MSGRGQCTRQWVISGVAGRKEMHLTERKRETAHAVNKLAVGQLVSDTTSADPAVHVSR